jgi:chromosome segregation ATPase
MKTRYAVAVSLLSIPDFWKIYAKRFMLLSLLPFILCSSAFAQNLDDFRSAAAADGVKLIPFKDMQSEAATMAAEVERRKDAVKNLNYDVFASQKDNLLKENKKNKEQIESTKKEMAEFKSKHPDGSASTYEDEIKKYEANISDNNNKLNDLNAKLKDAADAFGNLNAARAKLREQFDKVIKELSSAKSSPAKYLGEKFSDEDRKKFENYISVIVDQIKSQIDEHKKQEEGAKGTKEKYEQLINKKEI